MTQATLDAVRGESQRLATLMMAALREAGVMLEEGPQEVALHSAVASVAGTVAIAFKPAAWSLDQVLAMHTQALETAIRGAHQHSIEGSPHG